MDRELGDLGTTALPPQQAGSLDLMALRLLFCKTRRLNWMGSKALWRIDVTEVEKLPPQETALHDST